MASGYGLHGGEYGHAIQWLQLEEYRARFTDGNSNSRRPREVLPLLAGPARLLRRQHVY